MSEIEELKKELYALKKDVEQLKRIIRLEPEKMRIRAAETVDELDRGITEILLNLSKGRDSGGVFLHAGILKEKGKIFDRWSHVFTDEEVYGIDPRDIVNLVSPFNSEQRIRILRILTRHRSANMSLISRETGLAGGELYHHLKELLHRGYIESKRRGIYSITAKGEISLIIISGLAAWFEPTKAFKREKEYLEG